MAASCAVPGLFAPVRLGGALYLDGGAVVAPTFPSVPTMSSCVVGFSLDRARRFGFSTPRAAMGGPLGGRAPRIVAHLEDGRVGAAATEGAATCAADSAWVLANVTVTDLARPFSPVSYTHLTLPTILLV